MLQLDFELHFWGGEAKLNIFCFVFLIFWPNVFFGYGHEPGMAFGKLNSCAAVIKKILQTRLGQDCRGSVRFG